MPSKTPGPEVIVAFERKFGSTADISDEQLKEFLSEHFEEAGSDLPAISITPRMPVKPEFLAKFKSKEAIKLVKHIHNLWFELTREAASSVSTHPLQHTLVPVPHPFVIPGDRFREAYYWDTYWSIEGMILTGLEDIAKGIVLNMLHLIEMCGHVPNGNRIYYINRSQPPLLSQMVKAVYTATQDRSFLGKALAGLIQEHSYWTSGRKVVRLQGGSGQQHTLTRYFADWDNPRPEAYRLDVGLSDRLPAQQHKQFYRNMSSCAESGWDFSSRWCSQVTAADGGPVDLTTIRTTAMVPVDLNSMLYQLESNIAAFAVEVGQADVAARYAGEAEARRVAIQDTMWSQEEGQWHDLLLEEMQDKGLEGCSCVRFSQIRRLYVANWVPLYCGVTAGDAVQGAAAVAALRDSGLIQVGGVSTSLVDSKQQWDLPNGWPNMQQMVVEGCREYGGEEGQRVARAIAERWVANCYQTFVNTNDFWEKYDVTQVGGKGGGGEYVVQRGFGWTNGVLLQMLDHYGEGLLAGASRGSL